MTPLEAMARAMCKADGYDPDADWREGDGVTMTFETDKPERWRTYVAKCRAGLAAIREPTRELLAAAYGHDAYDPAIRTTITAMFDEILKETP